MDNQSLQVLNNFIKYKSDDLRFHSFVNYRKSIGITGWHVSAYETSLSNLIYDGLLSHNKKVTHKGLFIRYLHNKGILKTMGII